MEPYDRNSKVLNNGHGRVTDFAISAVKDVAIRITVIAVRSNYNIEQKLLKLSVLYNNLH
jgi:hypothetical protein